MCCYPVFTLGFSLVYTLLTINILIVSRTCANPPPLHHLCQKAHYMYLYVGVECCSLNLALQIAHIIAFCRRIPARLQLVGILFFGGTLLQQARVSRHSFVTVKIYNIECSLHTAREVLYCLLPALLTARSGLRHIT